MGTLLNAAAVMVGSLIGIIGKKKINEQVNDALLKVLGLSAAVIGLLGLIGTMITIEDGVISSEGILLLIVSLALGTFVGTSLKIEKHLDHFAEKIEKRFKMSNFTQGFVTASLLYCIGALAIMGPLKEVLEGDRSLLYLKSALDGIVAIFLGASLGIGVFFSAFMILLVQGLATLGATWIGPFISVDMLNNFCMVGYAIIVMIGTNMMGATKIKTANTLPALIIPIIWTLIGLGRY